MKGFVLVCCFLFVFLIAFSQDSINVDSLLLIHKNAKTQVEKKEGCCYLISYYFHTDIQKSVQYAKEGLQFRTDVPDSLDAVLLYLLATVHSSFREFDTAISLIDESLEISKGLEDSLLIGRVMDQKGYIYFRKGDIENAYEFNIMASMYLGENGDLKDVAKNKHRRGVFAKHLGHYEEAIGLYLEAIKLFEEIGDKMATSRLFVDLGNLFNKTKDYENVLKYSFIALEIAEKMGDSTGIAATYNNIGLAYHGKKNDSMALVYYIKAREINLQKKNELWLAYNLHNIGNIYSGMGDYESAINNINKSIEIKLRLKGNNQIASSYSALGMIYSKKEMDRKAAALLGKAIDAMEKSSVSDANLVVYQNAAEVNCKLNNFEEAYKYLQISYEMKDSLFSKEKVVALHNIQAKYETVKKEQKIKDLEYQQNIQQSKEIVLIGGLVALGLVFLVFVVAFYMKRKKGKEIALQKDALHKKEKALSVLEMEDVYRKKDELRKELNYKSKQLTTHALNMMQKNKLLQELQKDVIVLSENSKGNCKQDFAPVIRGLDRNLKLSQDWDLFKKYFEDVNKEFYAKLKAVNYEITVSEMRLAALVKLKMNIKETASVLNLEPTSVKTARYRLKKKLNIPPDTDLSDFINTL